MAEQSRHVKGTYPYQVGTTVSYTGYGRSPTDVSSGIVHALRDSANIEIIDHSGRRLRLHVSQIVDSPYRSWVEPGKSISYNNGKTISVGTVNSVSRGGSVYVLGSNFPILPEQVMGPAESQPSSADLTIDEVLALLTPEERKYILDNYDIVRK